MHRETTSVPEVVPPRRQRLGEILVGAGALTEVDLDHALQVQSRTGCRLGRVLLGEGSVDADDLAAAVAAQAGLPVALPDAFHPDPRAVRMVPAHVATRHRVVPLAVDADAITVASAQPVADGVRTELGRHVRLPVRTVITSDRRVDETLHRLYREDYIRISTAGLLLRSPDECAYRVLTRPQKLVCVAAVVVFAVAVAIDAVLTAIVCTTASVVFSTAASLYKFRVILRATGASPEVPVTDRQLRDLDERDLPVYTVLVPLYREANVLPRLLHSIRSLDYPPTKLDVKLLVEEDDRETVDALAGIDLPPHVRTVVVPHCQPKTKPKACNYGLIHAEGRYVVIYDAEDRPEADQLRKVVAAFAGTDERVVCIQCKLDYFNSRQNLLTRWFTGEYSMWFDLLLPGLTVLGAPVPLGGTSNHFRRDALVHLGGWDPYNVTEDADLGVRLHRAGFATGLVDSTTFEEANSQPRNWVRQRSRWVKGYIQTWLVHMRHPVRLWRQLGAGGWLSFQMVVGGTFVGLLLNPIYWLLTLLWVLTESGLIRSLFPGVVYLAAAVGMYLGNFAFVYANVLGTLRRRYFDLVRSALVSPVYWLLMSIGAWRGALQLLRRPFYWEKTVHGLDVRHGDTGDRRQAAGPLAGDPAVTP